MELSSQALNEQLSAIMCTLSQAAVAQMCAVVEQRFAAWRKEISRKEQEIQELRSKLHLIESIVLKGRSGGEGQEEQPGGAGGEQPQEEQVQEEVQLPEVVVIKNEDLEPGEACGDLSSCADRGPQMPSVEEITPIKSPASETSEYSSSSHHGHTSFSVGSQFSSPMDMDLQPPAWMSAHMSAQKNELEPGPSLHGDSEGLGLKLVSVMSGSSGSSSPQQPAFEFSSFNKLMEQSSVGVQTSRAKRFPCSICQKSFTTGQSLEVHTRIHTGERPFRCEQCGKRFTQSAHLNSHYHSIHKPEQANICPVCPRGFSSIGTLRAHMSKWHP